MPPVLVLHRAVKGPAQFKEDMVVGDQLLVHPVDILDEKAGVWDGVWDSMSTDLDAIHELMRQQHAQSRYEPLAAITGADVKRASFRMNTTTGLGIDAIGPADFQRLSDVGFYHTAAVLNYVEVV